MAETDGLRMEVSRQDPEEEEGVSSMVALLEAYIVCLKIAQVSDDTNPDQER